MMEMAVWLQDWAISSGDRRLLPALGFWWWRRDRYLEGISWLTLERDHIVHQIALSCLHPIAGYSWFGTTAQAHR